MSKPRRKLQAGQNYAKLFNQICSQIPKIQAHELDLKEVEQLRKLIARFEKTVPYDISLRLKMSKLKRILNGYESSILKKGCDDT